MRVGAYEIQGEAGRGGMGAVYRARTADGRSVAIKLLLTRRSASASDGVGRGRRILGSLGEAEGFVPLLDHGVAGPGPYIVMPFLGGGTLRDRLKEGRLDRTTETLELGVRLAEALGHAHEKGL